MSLHADALAALTTWSAPDAAQEQLRERYVAHLRAHPDGLERACRPAHLTAGVLVIDATGEHVLLNLHRKARRWFHFGGHLEADDATLAAAALREGREESGIDDLELHPEPAQLDAHVVEFCGAPGRVEHLDVRYVARAGAGVRPQVSEESLDVRWWPVDALPEDLEQRLHELLAIARARFGVPGEPGAPSGPDQSTASLGGASVEVAADQPSK